MLVYVVLSDKLEVSHLSEIQNLGKCKPWFKRVAWLPASWRVNFVVPLVGEDSVSVREQGEMWENQGSREREGVVGDLLPG